MQSLGLRLSDVIPGPANNAMSCHGCRLTAFLATADICCGTGTIGLLMALRAQEVVGIDIVPSAIQDAKANATLNCASS